MLSSRRLRFLRPEVQIREVPAMAPGRTPPHDLDAEAVVLSAILLSHDALAEVADFLKPEHFYSDANGRIYDAMLSLDAAGTPVDVSTVASYLRDREQLGGIGGPGYLAQLADATPAVAHVPAHARVVFEKWRMRAFIATCQRFAAEGYGDVGDTQRWLDEAESEVFALATPATAQSTTVDLRDALRTTFQQMVAAAERGDHVTGLATGLTKLDEQTSGLHPGDLIVVAARPGMGKTAFLLNVAVNVAAPRVRKVDGAELQVPGDAVAVFSLEMPREQIALRMACSEARVDLRKARGGHLQIDDWRRMTEASTFLASLPIKIDDASGQSLLSVRAKARRIQAEERRAGRKLGLIVIDYLQLLDMGDAGANRDQQIGDTTRGLKRLAKELEVPVILLSQVNRKVEERSDKRPVLSDLRESGNIEADADAVVFVYRDEYYNPESKAKGIAELIIGKQRNGPPGRVHVRFDAACTRFDNLAAGYEGDDA